MLWHPFTLAVQMLPLPLHVLLHSMQILLS